MKAMLDLVERKEVLKILDRRLNMDDRTRYVFKNILDLPRVNTAPISCGEWILNMNQVVCSQCNAILFEFDQEDLPAIQSLISHLGDTERFCFHCGSDMHSKITKEST